MSDRPTIIAADWVAPMDRPPLRGAAVVVARGRIADVGDAREMSRAYRDADPVDLGRAVVLPGLVNAHTHLELSTCCCGDPPTGGFADWIAGLRARMGVDENGRTLEQVVTDAVAIGVEQCRRFGVTTVGDITQQGHLTRPLLRDAQLRCVSYGEALGLALHRPRYEELLARALDDSQASETLRIGLTPHAPYTVDLDGYRQCLEIARQRNLPLATHLAETPDEAEFLRHHTGPFRQIWERLGRWAEPVPTFDGEPLHFAHAIGLLEHPTLLAHVNYCDDAGLALLAGGRASVVYCPRTHAYFGHPPHRWGEMLARGINVAIGTDSCASSPDLNVVEELRVLRRVAPDVPAQGLWEMITVRAARAVALDGHVGTLARGKRADLVAFAVDGDDPLESILREPRLPAHVWFDGRAP